MKKAKSYRTHKLAKMRDSINRDSYPRLEMFLLVCFTGMAGFLTSYGLLQLGFNTIWLRYLVSIGASYLCFMILLRLWMWWKTSNVDEDLLELGESVDFIPLPSGNSSSAATIHGGGGSFDGGGASGDWDGSGIGDALGSAAEAEEGAIPLIVIGALIFALFSIFIVVFSLVSSAPILFSELLVDGMLSASLYRRLKGVDKHHWLESALKRTIWPFVFVAIVFSVVGWTMGHFVPNAHGLGDILSHWFAHK